MQCYVCYTIEELVAFDQVDAAVEVYVSFDVDGPDVSTGYRGGATCEGLARNRPIVLTVYDAAGIPVTPESFGFTRDEILENLMPQIEGWISDNAKNEDAFDQVEEDEGAAEDAYWDARMNEARER